MFHLHVYVSRARLTGADAGRRAGCDVTAMHFRPPHSHRKTPKSPRALLCNRTHLIILRSKTLQGHTVTARKNTDFICFAKERIWK